MAQFDETDRSFNVIIVIISVINIIIIIIITLTINFVHDSLNVTWHGLTVV